MGAIKQPEPALKRGRGRPRVEPAILRCTLELVERLGARNVTMEAIADRAGVSKVTLYRRFPSKSVLMADVLMAELSASLPINTEGPPLEAICDHVRHLAAALQGRIGLLFREVTADCIADPAALAMFRDRYLGLRRMAATQLIARGIAEGCIRAGHGAEACHDALYGAVFYRFLFGFGLLDDNAIAVLLEASLSLYQRSLIRTLVPKRAIRWR